jgi:hypothetical protein
MPATNVGAQKTSIFSVHKVGIALKGMEKCIAEKHFANIQYSFYTYIYYLL